MEGSILLPTAGVQLEAYKWNPGYTAHSLYMFMIWRRTNLTDWRRLQYWYTYHRLRTLETFIAQLTALRQKRKNLHNKYGWPAPISFPIARAHPARDALSLFMFTIWMSGDAHNMDAWRCSQYGCHYPEATACPEQLPNVSPSAWFMCSAFLLWSFGVQTQSTDE